MMLHGHCCRCVVPDPPPNDCTATFYRYYEVNPTPLASVPPVQPCPPFPHPCPDPLPEPPILHNPNLEWEWYTPEIDPNPFGASPLWRCEFINEIFFFLYPVGDPFYPGGFYSGSVILPPLRYTLDYPEEDGADWDRGDWDRKPEGNIWPITTSNDGIPSGTAMHSLGGRIRPPSHIQGAGLQANEYPHKISFARKGSQLDSAAMYPNVSTSNPLGYSIEGRIRYIRRSFEPGQPEGEIIDLVPPPSNEHWSYTEEPPYVFEKGFLLPVDWGRWQADIPINISGHRLHWDVWYELRFLGNPPLITYDLKPVSMYHEKKTGITYNWPVMPDWDKTTEDWELTFVGYESPTDGTETMKFSEMDTFSITDCYCQGTFTWGGIWDGTTLQCTFRWDREVCVIQLESLTSDFEYGPYNSSGESYLSSLDSGLDFPISKWFNSETNKYYYGQGRGTWSGGDATFNLAHNATVNVGSYDTAVNASEWPGYVSIVRTTQ